MPDLLAEIEWQHPAWLVGALLGGATTALLVWARARRSCTTAGSHATLLVCALLRGAAVAALLVFVAGPRRGVTPVLDGHVLRSVPATEAQEGGTVFDRTLVHGTERTVGEAVDQLLAGRPAGRPADVSVHLPVLDEDLDRLPAGDDLARVTVELSAPALASEEPAPPPPPSLVPIAGGGAAAPVRLALVGGVHTLPVGRLELSVGTERTEVEIPPGRTRLALPELRFPSGTHVVAARLPDGVTTATVVDVSGPPTAVVVTAAEGEATTALVTRLRAQGIDVETVSEERVSPETLRRAAVVILPPGVGAAVAPAVATRVRDGGGLLAFGSTDARGLRRFRDGPLELVLPVETTALPPPPPPPPVEPPPPPPEDPPPALPDRPAADLEEGPKDALRVALLLCIDRSGSMVGPKLRLAKLSAFAATRSLDDDDRVGVVAFHEESEWIVPFQPARNRSDLARRVDAMDAGGGTNFYPALELGYEALRAERAGIRHVILLTDGETRAAVFRDLVESGAREGITLSTIAVGDGAETPLLARLAGWGGGRLYLATDPRRLPEVVTVDTRRFVEEVREERRNAVRPDDLPRPPEPDRPPNPPPTPPAPDEAPPPPPEADAAPVRLALRRDASFLRGFSRSDPWPRVAATEEVRPHPGAHVALTTDTGEPAVTLGRAGLGRVAVVTFDPSHDASPELWEWPRAGVLSAQLVRSLAADEALHPRVSTGRVVRHADEGTSIVFPELRGGRVELTHVGTDRRLVGRLEPRAGAGVLSSEQPLDAGSWLGLHEADDGRLTRVTAMVRPTPPPRPLDPIAVADRHDLELRSEPPRRRSLPGVPRREPVGSWLLPAVLGLLLGEAAARRVLRRTAG